MQCCPQSAEFDHAARHRIVDFRQIGDKGERLALEQPAVRQVGAGAVALFQPLCEAFRQTVHRDSA